VASTQATIDLVVRGSNAVNKLIQDVGQLESAVNRINSRTLDVAPASLGRRASALEAAMQGSAARANDLGRDRNQILSQQRQAVDRLTQAQLSQQRALERAAAAERELSRLGRRDESVSNRIATAGQLRNALRESAGEAERLGDQMTEASAEAGRLQSRLDAIRQATRNAISAASGLIDANQTRSAANAVNALAAEYNRYGDSLRRSGRESNLVDRTLPRQINTFTNLRNQIEQAGASLADLRSELGRLGGVEAALDIPPPRAVGQREIISPSGMAESAQQEAEAQRIQQENELRQRRNARRAEISTQVAAGEADLTALEARASELGRTIARNQDLASRMIANRDPANRAGLSVSLNQIQAQAESLALVANNSAIASTAFNRFTVGAEMASIKLARAQQNTFTALAAGFSSGGGANMPAGLGRPEEVAGARSLVGQVVTEMPTFATGASEAALNGYINMLQSLKAIVPGLSIEYRALEEAIARANEEMRSAQLGIVGAPSSRLGSLGAVTQRQKSEERAQKVQEKRQKNINDVFEKQNDIVDQINSSRLSGDEKASFRERVERAVNALIEDRLEDSKEMTRLIERQLKLETAMQKGAGGGRKTPAADPLKEESEARRIISRQLEALNDIQTRYAIEERKGVQLANEKIELGRIINAIAKDEVAFTKDNTKAIGESIRTLNALGRYAKNRAIEQGTYAGGSKTGGTKSGVTTAEQLEARRGRLLDSARGGLSQLIDLERKGVVVSDERLKVEQAISDIQSLRGKASKDELVTLAQKVIAAKDFAKGMAIDLKAGALPGAGLQAALQSLQEARQGRQQFLGTMSPAEGIDKIVREFNTGKPVAQNLTSTFAQDIQSGGGEMAKAATSAFTAVKNAIEKVWKIKSPSGVIIEIVKNIVSTFITEILAAGPSVRSAVEDTFNSKGIDRDYGDVGTRNPRTPSPAFGLDPNVALRLGGGRVTGGYPPVSGIFAPGSTPPIGGFGTGYPFFPPYQMTRTRRLPTPGMKGAQFPVDPMVDLRRNRPEDTSKVVVERIKQFRADIDNFWEGTEFQFEAVSRLLKSSTQLSFARLARRLQQSKELTPDQQFKQTASEAQSLLSAGSGGVVDRARQGVRQLLEFFRSIGDFVAPNYEDLSKEPAKQIRRGIFAEGGPTFGKTFVSGQGEDRYKLGYTEGMLGIPDDLQDIPLEGGNKIRSALESFYDKIVKTLGGAGGGGPRPPVGGGPGGGFYNDPGDLARRATEAAQRGPEALLGLKELAAPAKVSTKELKALSAILKEFRSVLDPTVEGFDQLNKRLRNTAANIDRQLERRDPDADFLTRNVGSRGGAAISEGLIGGAFPLLFGQGIGASVGGGLGGAIGGFAGGGLGFGLSLIGTALGTAFDTLNQAAQDTGKALNYPIEGFENLKAAGLFASREQEYYISKLIETGQTSKATAEIQAEMIKKIGVSGVNDLADLGDASSKLSKVWAEFNLQLQAALAGPMAGLLEWVTNIVGAMNESSRTEQQAKDIAAGLTGEAKRSFLNQIEAIAIQQASIPFGIGPKEAAKRRAGVIAEFGPLAKPVKAKEGKLTPEQEVANLDKAIEKADKARSLVQQGVALERSGVDLRLSVEDTVYGLRKRATDMEREAIEFRRSIEDQIFGKRQELEQKLIENERKRQQNAIDAFDLQLQQASAGLDPIAQGVVDAARDYLRIRAEGEANLQQAEKQLKLELQRIDQEVNRYKLQVEDRVSQMAIQRDEFSRDVTRARLQIENQIADRVVQVEEYRLAMAKHRYEMEIDLEKKKQIVAQEGLAVQATGGYTGAKVDGFPIGSRPGMRRHPITGEWREHKGVDIPAPTGTALGYEIGGKILSAGWIDGYGKTLRVELENGMTALSAHLDEIFVRAGQKFQANQRLATVGSTGNSTGPHVHQESRMNGKADPYASLPFLQLGKAVSGKPGAGSDPDIYLQPGVGYFSRKTGLMVRGLAGGAGQAASAGASAQVASGAIGATPVLQAAPAMPVLPGAPQRVGINDLMQQYLEIIEQIKAATASASAVDRQALAIRSEAARLAFEQQALAPVLQYKEQNRELEFEIQKRKERNRLALEGFAPEVIEGEMRVLEIQRDLNSVLSGLEISTNQVVKAELERLKLNPELVNSAFSLTEATLAGLVATTEDAKKQEELRAKLQAILDLRNKLAKKAEGEAGSAVKGAKGAAEASIMSPREKIEGRIGELKKEIAELTNIGNLSMKVADGIGNAFGQAFQGLISGSMSAQEALASFFKSTAEAFLAMATEIIAKQMVMVTLQTILKALGAAAGNFSGGTSSAVPTDAGGWANSFATPLQGLGSIGPIGFAKGGAFTNSIVSSPTLFQFADGGITRMGEMGEDGPEAIMPLKRGPDGRLGVDASGMAVPYRRPAAAAATPEMEVPYQRSGSALAVPYLKSEGSAADDSMNATIDVKFETVRIGGVDYVTRDEAEQIGRESAQRGADIASKRYRNSPSARRRDGIG
jgi:murein DD-endopeptidase MepM/ murein hydrolase activator NlpD